jgi:tetratricopeptide (TPR) repeat protein
LLEPGTAWFDAPMKRWTLIVAVAVPLVGSTCATTAPKGAGNVNAFYLRGEDDRAIELLREEVARDPLNAATGLELGQLLLEQGQFAEAEASCRRAAALYRPSSLSPSAGNPYPPYQRSVRCAASAALSGGDSEEALRLAWEAEVPGDDSWIPLHITLMAHLLLGQDTVARSDLERLARFEEEGLMPPAQVAQAALDGHLSPQALLGYLQAAAMSSAPQLALARLAPALAEAPDLPALVALRRSLESPDYRAKHLDERRRAQDLETALGWLKRKHPEPAKDIARRLLAEAPGDLAVVGVLAMAEQETGNGPGAIALMEGFALQHPKRAQAQFNLAVTYAALDQLAQAESAAERALTLNPLFPGVNELRARIAHRRHQTDAALSFCRKELELYPRSTRALLSMAVLLGEYNRHAESAAAFEKVILINEFDDFARLARLRALKSANEEQGLASGCASARAFYLRTNTHSQFPTLFGDVCRGK